MRKQHMRLERLETLQQKLDYASNSQEAIQAMLCKPLYQEAWLRGYGNFIFGCISTIFK